ncbi:MAG: site-2 protease family protein [Nitrosomonadaceae bacterium]
MDRIIQGIAIFALPVILAITLHEAAHGYVAKQYGDLTAYAQGRVTLNPLRHIDPMGTIIVPLLLLAVSSPYLFGWAKPVPVNFGNLRHPKRDMLWVAAAGPGANLLMAFLWALVFKLGLAIPESNFSEPMLLMGQAGILINVILLVLNLLPLPPLDGGRIAVSLLPQRIAYRFAQIEPYGFIILLALLFTGVLGAVIGPFILITIRLVAWLVGLQV